MTDCKKIVLKVDAVGDECKAKAMSTVAKFQGVNSVAVDGEGTLTVVGEVDVVRVAKALRKAKFTPRVLSVGPGKEEKKPDEKKPDEKKPAPDEAAKNPPPCCSCQGCCACRPAVPVPAHPFPAGAVVCYEEAAAGNACVIL